MLTKRISQTSLTGLRRMIGQYKLQYLKGDPRTVSNTNDVTLRGVRIKGRYNDLPNLIFFPELCDVAENWVPFFTDPQNKILEYRNVHILYPRNFGNSDRHSSFEQKDISNDLARYMYEHKISTATIGGHGAGANLALKAAIENKERTTGFFSIDHAPVNYHKYEAFRGFVSMLQRVKTINLHNTRAKILSQINHSVEEGKWRNVMKQNVKRSHTGIGFEWAFDIDAILHNLTESTETSIASWNPSDGIYPGRTHFIIPENSEYVRLGTNTLAIYKTCVKNRGFAKDIWDIQTPEGPMNHWIYEVPHLRNIVGDKVHDFLRLYDGVHVMNSDRTAIQQEFIREQPNINASAKTNSDRLIPHYHHNWRFSSL